MPLSVSAPRPISIGFVVFPGVTQLDFTGPLQVLCRLPGAQCHIIARSAEPVTSDAVLRIPPTATFKDCPHLDLICVPGGFGVADAIADDLTIDFVRRRAAQASYVTSVCTGAFVLGAAGLLKGRRAATHWAYRELLPLVGAAISTERVCHDGNIYTGGGVTAGIDFALKIAADVISPTVAQSIQLALEYDPHPPFDAGNPRSAPEAIHSRLVANVYASAVGRMRTALKTL